MSGISVVFVYPPQDSVRGYKSTLCGDDVFLLCFCTWL